MPGSPDPTPFPEKLIDVALNMLQTPPAIAAISIAAEGADGAALIDVTQAFSGDIESASARSFVALRGIVPAAVDPARSYIERARAGPETLNVRTHLTFLATNPKSPASGTKPVSVVIGHSFVFLPEKPMVWRRADPRIGYFTARLTDYESGTGNLFSSRNVITKFRLEKKNPELVASNPVKPIVFYIGPGVPDRWRPYIKAGVEMWKPVFEKAGFSNAIMAADAPSPQQDPDWFVEDVSRNVIRWVTTEHANSYGPHVVDPRSGEVLSAHILNWPSVLDYFSKYYFALFGTVDPEAAKLPHANLCGGSRGGS